MEKPKRSEWSDDVIQHIQYFLPGKEAAQTTLVAKSWYRAWSTRPNLDFDQRLFGDVTVFWSFANSTLDRYETHKLTIDRLKVCVTNDDAQVDQLIMRALEIGIKCLGFKTNNLRSGYVLTQHVFLSEKLTSLCVAKCKIIYNGLVGCPNLKSLILRYVDAQDNIIWNILSNCPLLEKFSISSNHLFTDFGNLENHVDQFPNMKSMFFFRINVHSSFFSNLSSKFPSLEYLALHDCQGCSYLRISSPSLKVIIVVSCGGWNWFPLRMNKCIHFNVPRLRKFIYSNRDILDLLVFETTPTTKWESHITIETKSCPDSPWFYQLTKFLKMLVSSEITLQLNVCSESTPVYNRVCHSGLLVNENATVERLVINGVYPVESSFYHFLFNCCFPIFISHIWCPSMGRKRNEEGLIRKRRMQKVCLEGCNYFMGDRSSNIDKLWIRKAKLKFFDDREPRSLDATEANLAAVADGQRILLHLKWGNK